MVRIFRNGKLTNANLKGSQYDGEKIPGDLNSWDVLSSDSNYILESTYGELSRRSMTLYHQHPLARGAINKQVDYAVGQGLLFRSQPDWSILGKSKDWAKDWGKDFQKIIDFYYQTFNFYEKQGILMRGGLAAGDALLSYQHDDNGFLTDIIEFAGDQIDWEKMDDNYYLGIKHDSLLRKQGIMLIDGKPIDFVDKNGDQNIVQFMIKELPRQLRGYPLLYSIINHAKQDDRHTDAIVQRAVMEAVQFATFKGDTTDIKTQIDNLTRTALEQKTGGAVATLRRLFGSRNLNPGSIMTMGTDEEYAFTDLKTPSGGYKDFKDVNLQYIGAATGTPGQVIISKYDTSYTAHKGVFNDFIKSYMYKRGVMKRTVIYPTNKEILKDAILQGFIKAPGFFEGSPLVQRAYLQGNVLGPIPGAINTLQEVNADVKSVDNAFTLRSDIAAKNGNEWGNMIEEWGEEQAEFFGKSPDKQAELVQEQVNKDNENTNKDGSKPGGDE